MPAPTPAAAAFIVALFHGAYLIRSGVQFASGDSATYAHWSARLVETGFDYPELLAEAAPAFPAFFYALFATLLALLRTVFAEDWSAALVTVNLAAHAGLAAMVMRLAALATGHSAAAAWTVLILFLGCHELLRWVPFVLSDVTFVFLAFAIFSLAAGRILEPGKSWLPVAFPAVAAIFYRPTGIVLVADLAWAAFLARRKRLPPWPVLAAAIAGFAALVAVAFAWLVEAPERWPFDAFSRAFEVVGSSYANGEVVRVRFATYHEAPSGLADILLISADRFRHFFAIGAAEYSLAHRAVSLAFFVPCYGLAAWLGIAMWRGDSQIGEAERRLFMAAAGAVFAYAFFHALVQIDFDWRYRLPVIPHLMLLAAGGAADLARRARGP